MRAPVRTSEVELQLVSANLAAGDQKEAGRLLASLRAHRPGDWRVTWLEGVAALAETRPGLAEERFAAVYDAVPGELAPKLARGVAAGMDGRPDDAIRWYEVVSRTDPWHTTAAFGLARCAVAEGSLSLALDAYDRVPDASVSHTHAQTAKIRCLLDRELGGARDVSTLRAAGKALEALDLDAEQHTELLAELLLRALLLVEEKDLALPPEIDVAGQPFAEHELRLALERTYRQLARFATSAEDRIRLVDWANRVRPRSWT
jgi:serine/threonine-protein kinase PknG